MADMPPRRRVRRGIGEDGAVMTTEPPVDIPTPVNTAALRLSRSPMDMTKAVLILLVPVLLAFGAYVFFFGGSDVITIDVSGTYAEARGSAGFSVLEPTGLPSGWHAVSSSYQTLDGTKVLRVGYVGPSGAGIQLVESDRAADTLITEELGSVRPLSTSTQIGARTWGQIDAGKRTDRALVNTEDGRTVIIMGQAGLSEMRQFAGALR